MSHQSVASPLLKTQRMQKARWILFLFIILNLFSTGSGASEGAELWSTGALTLNSKHRITLLDSGVASLEARLMLIEKAQKSVELEYYIFKTEKSKSTRLILQALHKKAQQGVRIRILVDRAPLVQNISEYLAQVLKDQGIQTKKYNETFILNIRKANHRNHRKLMVIDDQWAILGGRNISDKYYDLDSRYNFLDRDILVEGPIVRSIRASFDVFWNDKKSKFYDKVSEPTPQDYGYQSVKEMRRNQRRSETDRRAYQSYIRNYRSYKKGMAEAHDLLTISENDQKLRSRIARVGIEKLKQEFSTDCDDIVFMTDFPEVKKRTKSLYDIMSSEISKSKSEVLIENPYFVVRPNDKLYESMSQRGVSVSVLTNSLYSTDNLFTATAFYSRVNALLKTGVNFHLYAGGPLAGYDQDMVQSPRWGIHSKSMVVDTKHSVIGSYNFDPRSMNLNAELAVMCKNNPDFAQVLTEKIYQRMSNSFKLDENGSAENFHSKYSDSSDFKILMHYITMPFAAMIEDSL